jgi:hypothetical protein
MTTLRLISGPMSIEGSILLEISLLSSFGLKYTPLLKVQPHLTCMEVNICLKRFTSNNQLMYFWQRSRNWTFFKHFVNTKDGKLKMEATILWMLSTTFLTLWDLEDITDLKYTTSWSTKFKTYLMRLYICFQKQRHMVFFTLEILPKL